MPETALLDIFEIIALGTGAFLGVHFLTLGGKTSSARFLGWFLTLAFLPDLITAISFRFGHEESLPFSLLPNTTLIYPPFLLFYARGITAQLETRKWAWFIPAAVLYVAVFLAEVLELEAVFVFEGLFSYLFGILVFLLILKTLHQHQKNVFKYFSSLEDRTLNWLRVLCIVLILFNVFWLIEDVVKWLLDDDFNMPLISQLATIVTVYWIGFSSLRQPEIFSLRKAQNDTIPIEVLEENLSAETTVLSSEEETLYDQLLNMMKQDQPYRNPDLSLRELAEELAVSDKALSKVVNVKTQSNFYHFVNGYRIEAFKKALHENPSSNLTLFGLAQNCGFRSKSTFYSAFKRIEGCTPSEFVSSAEESKWKHSNP